MKGQKHEEHRGGDIVYTPDWLAKKMCSLLDISGDVLEPCKGQGVFLKYLPKNTEWCEITEGRDFYDYKKKVDWIVTNPPYSDFNRFLEHAIKLADNIAILIPTSKVFNSMGRVKMILGYGGIVSCHILSGGKAGFPFGFPVSIYHMKRGYSGQTEIGLLELPEYNNQKLL